MKLNSETTVIFFKEKPWQGYTGPQGWFKRKECTNAPLPKAPKSSKHLANLIWSMPMELSFKSSFSFSVIHAFCRRVFPTMIHIWEDFLHCEWLMQADPKEPFYRDHLTHQLNVGMIGWILLKSQNLSDKYILYNINDSPSDTSDDISIIADKVAETLENIKNGVKKTGFLSTYLPQFKDKITFDRKFVIQTWWLASFLHDMGYYANFVYKMAECAQNAHPALVHGMQLCGLTESRVLEYELNIVGRYFRFLAKEFSPGFFEKTAPDPKEISTFAGHLFEKAMETTHAAPAAVCMLAYLEEAKDFFEISLEERLAVNLAALAVLRHDLDSLWEYCGGIEKKGGTFTVAKPNRVDRYVYNEDPISYLLMLSDHIQEWDRPKLRMVPNLNKNVSCTGTIIYDTTKVDITVAKKELTVKIPNFSKKTHCKNQKDAYFKSKEMTDPTDLFTNVIFTNTNSAE